MDTPKPNISRIYDYVLGGTHNLEVDRNAVREILKVFPAYPRWARLNRDFLKAMATRWAAEGRTHLLDIGSGMPTLGHFHTIMTRARVLYSDNDPVTVAYAREVIGDDPRISYLEVDVRKTELLLRAAEQHFGEERKVAIGFIGVAYLIEDASLKQMLRTLYDWAAPGSVLALSQVAMTTTPQRNQETADPFRPSGAQIFTRDEAALRRIVGSWEVRELAPLDAWPGVTSPLHPGDDEGGMLNMLGVVLERS